MSDEIDGVAQPEARPSRARRVRTAVTVGAVLVMSGLLFAASAQLARGEGRQPQDLASLVTAETRRVATLNARVETLATQVQLLSDGADQTTPARDGSLVAQEGVVSGSLPVTGPGLTVTLDDAPASSRSISGDIHPDNLVVHQQDLQEVINALWAGGAEAMTLQGERVTSTSAFRCSGNILLLHGKVFSPPYKVEAVGDPKRLQAALDRSEGVQVYQEWVDYVHLGWSVQESSSLSLPRYTGSTELQYATVPDGTSVFG